jgi:TatA/E family protein of Tat protein translocase
MEGLFAPWHIVVVFVVALLVFGPSKLPEIGRQIGRGVREFRRFQDTLREDISRIVEDDDEDERHEKPDEQHEKPALPSPPKTESEPEPER